MAANSEKSLKAKYQLELWPFIVFHIAVFLSILLSDSFSLSDLNRIWQRLTVQKGVLAALAPLITVVLLGLLPSDIKAGLVFWRIKHPLPGCRVFTHLIAKDERINPKRLREKYGDLPFQLAEMAVPRSLFVSILDRINRLRSSPGYG